MFFSYATSQGYTTKNPCTDDITIPGEKHKPKEVEVFTDEEVAKLKKALVGHRLRLLVLMALGTGLRRGELLALRYSDIEGNEVHVHSSLSSPADIEADGSRHREYVIWEPKTKNSNRRVPIPKDLMPEITAHRAKQIEERMKLGIGGEPEFIFTTKANGFICSSSVNVPFNKVLKSAKLPPKKFHSLRHTYATGLVSRGADINTVMRLMGHSNINITMIYFHKNTEQMEKAAESLNEWFK